ncbi:hypothetical protein D3C73_1278110 [compost metagenome]
MAASAARIKKPGRPEVCKNTGLMSGVFTKKCGRKKSAGGGCEISSRYDCNSARSLRQVK